MYEIRIPAGVTAGGKFCALLGGKRYLLTCPQVVQTFFVASPDPPDPPNRHSDANLAPLPIALPSTVGICRGPAIRKQQVGTNPSSFTRELSEIFRGPSAQHLLAAQAAARLTNPNMMTSNETPEGGGVPQAIEFEDFFDSAEDHSFQEYKPMYFHKGLPHPDQLVQSASLSGVNPPPIDYELSLPENVR
jgi:hypothetical protein